MPCSGLVLNVVWPGSVVERMGVHLGLKTPSGPCGLKTMISGAGGCRRLVEGFTRLDLGGLFCAAVALGVFAVAPAVVRGGLGGQATTCTDNLRRLSMAWSLYAAENQERVVNNFAAQEIFGTIANKTYQNWTHTVVDWTTNPANTNQNLGSTSRLFPYMEKEVSGFSCPADSFLSPAQQKLGWQKRIRTYSMNGFMGAASAVKGDFSYRGENSFAPGYRQFLLTSSIPNPSGTVVCLDEHPDSVNDGYFINRPLAPNQWVDIPASHHDGGAGVSFADGSAEIHAWTSNSTKKPVRFAPPLQTSIPSTERRDFQWLIERMTVTASTLGIRKMEDNRVQVIWSQYPTNWLLLKSGVPSSDVVSRVREPVQRQSGQSSVLLDAGETNSFFRLIRL
jgi:prepilin-type processing-associated H-X9-DG protein